MYVEHHYALISVITYLHTAILLEFHIFESLMAADQIKESRVLICHGTAWTTPFHFIYVKMGVIIMAIGLKIQGVTRNKTLQVP